MRVIVRSVLAIAFYCVLASNTQEVKRTRNVTYGERSGVPLTLDVFQPVKPNGCGVIWIVSAGWYSRREAMPLAFPDLTDRGYTVFAVLHRSPPKFQIPDAMSDMHRAVRFIRHNASTWKVNPGRLGVIGSSAGGHLALVLATRGAPGHPDDADEVERESSAVQAVACYFPPTDFLNYGTDGHRVLGDGVMAFIKEAFPTADTNEEKEKLAREISPIYFTNPSQPPVLIMHGDSDNLVPIQQSQSFVQRSREAGATAKLVTKAGAGHGWSDFESDLAMFSDWFDEQLYKMSVTNTTNVPPP